MRFKSLLYRADYSAITYFGSTWVVSHVTTREAFARFCAIRYRDRWLMIVSGRREHLLRPFRSLLHCYDESVISDYDSNCPPARRILCQINTMWFLIIKVIKRDRVRNICKAFHNFSKWKSLKFIFYWMHLIH